MSLKGLTPKKILLNAIKEKLADTDIVKLTLIFGVDTDKYNVMLSTNEGKNLKVDITFDEITTIKKIFIRRIISKWKESYDVEPITVILEVNVINEELNIFIQTVKNDVLKFDYL